jgi:hypothetical protein
MKVIARKRTGAILVDIKVQGGGVTPSAGAGIAQIQFSVLSAREGAEGSKQQEAQHYKYNQYFSTLQFMFFQ